MSGVQLAKVVPEELWDEQYVQEAIDLWEINETDAKKFRAIQASIHKDMGPHVWNDPQVVLAFAEAQGMDHAEEHFRKMMAWRKRNRIDNFLKDYKPHPLMMDYSPMALLKDYDHQGDPIYVERGGKVPMQALLAHFGRPECLKHAIWMREVQSSGAWMDEYERRQGHAVKDITVIYDLEGLNYTHLDPNVLSFFKRVNDLTEENYPGPVKRVIFIRAPLIFRSVWAVAKHFFSEEERSKMIFSDSDYLGELSKWMDIDVLPPCINPDGHGSTAIGMPMNMEGGDVPSHVGQGGAGYVSPYAYCGGLTQAQEVSSPSFVKTSLTDKTDDSSTDEESDPENSPCKGTVRKMASLTISGTC